MKLRIVSFLLSMALLISLAACGGGDHSQPQTSQPDSQTEERCDMEITRVEGQVTVQDAAENPVSLTQPLDLSSGDRVVTEADGSVWLERSDQILLRADSATVLNITRKGQALTVEVTAGSLFFRVEGDLEKGETFSIQTPALHMNVPESCGWVTAEESVSSIALLEGSLECSGSAAGVVHAGERFTSRNHTETLTAETVPAFVLEEVSADPDLAEEILDACNLNLLNITYGDPDALKAISYIGDAESCAMNPKQAGELADALETWMNGMKAVEPEFSDDLEDALSLSAVLFDAGKGIPGLIMASNAPYPYSNISLRFYTDGSLQVLDRDTITAVGLQEGYLTLCGYQMPDGTESDLYHAWVYNLNQTGPAGTPCTWADLDEWATGESHIDGKEVTSDDFGTWQDRWVLDAPVGFSTGNGGSGYSWGTVPAEDILEVLRNWSA